MNSLRNSSASSADFCRYTALPPTTDSTIIWKKCNQRAGEPEGRVAEVGKESEGVIIGRADTIQQWREVCVCVCASNCSPGPATACNYWPSADVGSLAFTCLLHTTSDPHLPASQTLQDLTCLSTPLEALTRLPHTTSGPYLPAWHHCRPSTACLRHFRLTTACFTHFRPLPANLHHFRPSPAGLTPLQALIWLPHNTSVPYVPTSHNFRPSSACPTPLQAVTCLSFTISGPHLPASHTLGPRKQKELCS